ncbi:Uncharacterised protein [Mycobacteroides abscessus subsp. abscessus]|nr:Uncharacterised protein [Mycobacteroides abscessus subsp. abscessus]SHY40284.1 Uncharacterised protein [Mycobacteroides abscessus subsp. abscessus]SIB48542.1 Uncharacterised protein [Mycobacteroides abscessus subsp. abscessus]SIB94019.1 Uncharacterised protein [Mycobacteroides abscessus subsp. abscessus]SIC01458.1 Uncharacterised protein [Mycobacteroides abscessus subsp. abscessus]
MNVGELIAELSKLDPNLAVVMPMCDEADGEVASVDTQIAQRGQAYAGQPITWHPWGTWRGYDPPRSVARLGC